MDNFGYLAIAYLILWLGLFAYLFWMSGTVHALQAELRELRAALDRQERGRTAPDRTPVDSRGR